MTRKRLGDDLRTDPVAADHGDAVRTRYSCSFRIAPGTYRRGADDRRSADAAPAQPGDAAPPATSSARVRRPALDVDPPTSSGCKRRTPAIRTSPCGRGSSDFDPTELEALLLDRQVVRLVVQRGTVHVVTADDCLVLRPLAQPILSSSCMPITSYKRSFDGVDLDAVMDARRQTSSRPAAQRQTAPRRARRAIPRSRRRRRWRSPAATCLAFVQVPPRGLWNRRGSGRRHHRRGLARASARRSIHPSTT